MFSRLSFKRTHRQSAVRTLDPNSKYKRKINASIIERKTVYFFFRLFVTEPTIFLIFPIVLFLFFVFCIICIIFLSCSIPTTISAVIIMATDRSLLMILYYSSAHNYHYRDDNIIISIIIIIYFNRIRFLKF